MSEPKRQHPVAAISIVIDILKEYLVPFVVIVILGGRTDDAQTYYLMGAVVLIISLLIGGVLSWLRYTYRIEDGELKIEYGVLVRKRHFVRRDRIQVIDISSGLIQRLFGLVSVEVRTAGQSTSEATISAVTRDEAEHIKSLMSNKDYDEVKTEGPVSELHLNKMDLLIAASTAGSFGVALSIIGTITSQMNQFITETDIYNYLEGLDIPGTSFVIMIILAMIAIAWLLSLVGTIVKYSGFSLARRKDELIITRGLFEKKQLTIPYHRIQAVRVVEGILRQPFGYASVYVDSAGYGDEAGTSTILFPLIKKDRLKDFIQNNIPDYYIDLPSVSSPPRSIRRYLVRAMVPALAMVILISLIFTYGYISVLLLPLAAWLGMKRYRDAGAGFVNNIFILRFRSLARTTAIIKKKFVQAADTRSSYFQRRKELLSFMITVASGKTGATFSVKELDQKTGNELFARASSITSEDNFTESDKDRLPGW
ncbi:MAG: PH domain-containing protein [Balneolales bacterium]